MTTKVSAVGVLVAVVVVVALLIGRSGSSHEIVATFESATNLVPGARVTAGGAQVGSVNSIKLQNGLAAVTLNISDPHIWPLHQGTEAEIRWGGTVSYSNRYVELLPGPASDPPLRDDARLATADTVTPVEFDQLFNVFSAPARQSLGDLIGNAAHTFENRAQALHTGLTTAGPAVESVANVLEGLGEDPQALETLVGTGATTASTLRAEQPKLLGLVDAAAATFSEIADHAATTKLTLASLPPALSGARTALDRLNPTLTSLGTLVSEISPGAASLRALADPLSKAITTLGTVAPQLNQTLASVQTGAPGISALLRTAKPVLAAAKPALERLTPMVACVLPYGPELAGFITTWESMGSYYNASGHEARVVAQAFPFPNDSPLTPSQLVKTFPNLGYALVHPPGYAAGQTWLQPQCGTGSSALDPADDPETTG
jgi:phospholipid/cholesterol/gamma-HCH transport system substrate-binding protein